MTQPAVGFIGLGLMGAAMCSRLLDKGYPLTVLGHRARPNIDAAVSQGAVEAENGKDLAARSDIVMLCMDTSKSVESRMYGEDGVIAGLKPGATVIDFGTSLPQSTRAIGEAVEAAGGSYLDAPLGRTPSHALEGKLNIMCAGDEATYGKAHPVLADLGENVFHLGKLGSGHTIKLINNFFAMTMASAMAEAFAMADVAGIERQKLYDVMSAGPLHSGMMDFIKAYAVDGKPDMLAFSIRNACKDVGYYQTMVEDAGAASLVSPATRLVLNLALTNAFGDRNVPEIVDFFTAQCSPSE